MSIIIPSTKPNPIAYHKIPNLSGGVDLKPVQKTSEFRQKFKPWACQLTVVECEDAPREFLTTYHVRAGNPQDACSIAEKFWQKWEKMRFGFEIHAYPDTLGKQETVCIDEHDWFKTWKEALKAKERGRPCLWFGDIANPQVFTFYPNGWPEYWSPKKKIII